MKQSQLVTKTRKLISQQEASINAQLLERAGYISKLMAGVYTFLPLGLRVLSKIECLVRKKMNELEGQEILMPALQPREPWDVTGRWETVDVLYKIKVNERDFTLGPTHEEVVTPLIGGYIVSYKDLPRYVYQIQTKFRNEARPKSGLLRCREFRMKDLYSFHATEDDLNNYYEKVKRAYLEIFEECGLGPITYFTYASGGVFSKYSHEFQAVTMYGEDTIYTCSVCHIAINKEIVEEQPVCPQCNNAQLMEQKAIEIGNIFKLMYRFSNPFDVSYTDNEGKKKEIPMGCYGLGTTRLMGAIVETFHDERGILWPPAIAPYNIHLISLSKKPEMIIQAEELYQKLEKSGHEVLFDDRSECSAGEKFADADLIGIPIRIVISDKTAAQNAVEIKYRNAIEASLVPLEGLENFLMNGAFKTCSMR